QAEIARTAGRRQLAENLERAAELTRVPEEEILRIYEALRPGRATRGELEALAAALERDYQAHRTAELIREAAEAAPDEG
ncbi:MAG: diol dehydratase small subunit, partial [Bryobacteraceae bacterium]